MSELQAWAMRIVQMSTHKPAIASMLVLITLHANLPDVNDKLVFVNVTSKLHLTIQPINNIRTRTRRANSILSSAYSREFALKTLLPEMGGSIAIGYDSGDNEYLYVTIPGGRNHLFESKGTESFTDVTAEAAVGGNGNSLSATFADYDHSGHPSLFVVGGGGITLFHNNGNGTFTDLTRVSGLQNRPGEVDTYALLFDIDNDGFLDLLVTTYTELDSPPSKASFLFPDDFPASFSRLYRNLGNGRFADITTTAGLNNNPGRTRKAVAADFDNDGYLDLLLLRDNKPPALLMNQKHCTFRDATWDAGDMEKVWKYAFLDAQVADFDRDGKLDIALWSSVISTVLWNRGGGKFMNSGSPPALTQPNRPFGFVGTVLDLHNDSHLSLLAADDHYNLHLIANLGGSFQVLNFELCPETGAAKRPEAAMESAFLRDLAFVVPIRFPHAPELVLLTLSIGGELRAFEEAHTITEPHKTSNP